MAKIRVVLGQMSVMLADALAGLISVQPDMHVVANPGGGSDVMEFVRTNHADVLIVQGASAPEPFASVIAVEPLRLLVINPDGQAGALTHISAVTQRLNDLSSERLLRVVRSGREH